MSSEGRSSESRRPRGGRTKSYSARDNTSSSNAGQAPTRRNSQRAPAKQEFFTDSTNTSYIPSPSPARPAVGRPRQALGAAGGGKSFQAALRAALSNRDTKSPTASPRSRLHERSQSLASAPASSTTRRSPVQISELGSPTPLRPSNRDPTRTPSPARRASETTFPLVSPASFISESSEPPEFLEDIYRQIESEELIAEATGATDDDLSSVKSSPKSRRLKRISVSPSGLSQSIRAFSPGFAATDLEQEEEEGIEKLDLSVEPEEPDSDRPLRKDHREEKAEDLPIPQAVTLAEPSSDDQLRAEEDQDPLEPIIEDKETGASGSGASSPFEEVVPKDPEMLARDERRVKELIQSDRKAFSKAGGRKVSFVRDSSSKSSGAAESGSSSRESQSLSSGRDSEPSLNVPSTWGRKARSNPKWMQDIIRARPGADANVFNAEVAGQSVTTDTGGISKSINNWLQTAAATPLPEAGDSSESTSAIHKEEAGPVKTKQAFSKSRQWETRSSDGLLAPDKANSPYRDRSIERLEKSAVATSRLTALGQTRPSERLGRRPSDQSLVGTASANANASPPPGRELHNAGEAEKTNATTRSTRADSEPRPSLQETLTLWPRAPDTRKSTSSPEVSPTRIPRLVTKVSHPISRPSQSTMPSTSVDPTTTRIESGSTRLVAVTSRLQRQFGKPRPRAGEAGSDVEERLIPSIEEEPTDLPASTEEHGSDSRDLLKRFARAASSSPAPSRAVRPGDQKPNNGKVDEPPSESDILPGHQQPLRADTGVTGEQHVTTVANPPEGSSTRGLEAVADLSRSVQFPDPTHQEEPSVARTPAVKVGGIYTTTPKVTGGWIETPAPPAKHLGAIANGTRVLPDKYDETSLLEAARIVIGTNKVKKVGPKLRSAGDLETLAKTAPNLPRSALSAIIEHARKKNRGEEGSESDETLQLDESTIHSLEELLIKNDEELTYKSNIEDSVARVEPANDNDRDLSDEQVGTIGGNATDASAEPVGTDEAVQQTAPTDKVQELLDSASAVEEVKQAETDAHGEDTQQLTAEEVAGDTNRTDSDIITRSLSKVARVFATHKSQGSTAEQLEQLSKLSVPATKLETRLAQKQMEPGTSEPAAVASKASTRPEASIHGEHLPSSLQVKEPSQKPKKSRSVAIVAPNEECDQAGEFHDFIWPCENCRRRTKSDKPYNEDDKIGVVQWQTVHVPRLWRWPSLQDVRQRNSHQRIVTRIGEKGADDIETTFWLRLQTWIPHLTLLGWLALGLAVYVLLEYRVTAAYTPPFYAEKMVGFGVDADAPRPPLVLLKLIWRSPLCWLLRHLWALVSTAIMATMTFLGMDPRWFGLDEGVPREHVRWIFQEALEAGTNSVADVIARVRLADRSAIAVDGEQALL